jgi:hypothetical protein
MALGDPGRMPLLPLRLVRLSQCFLESGRHQFDTRRADVESRKAIICRLNELLNNFRPDSATSNASGVQKRADD